MLSLNSEMLDSIHGGVKAKAFKLVFSSSPLDGSIYRNKNKDWSGAESEYFVFVKWHACLWTVDFVSKNVESACRSRTKQCSFISYF